MSTTIESWGASKRFLPGGEATRINFTIQDALEPEVFNALPHAIRIGGGIALSVRYSPAASEDEIETTFSLGHPGPDDRWHVLQVFHSDLPESPR